MCLGCGKLRELVELVDVVDSGDRFDGGEVRWAKMLVSIFFFVIYHTLFFFSHSSVLLQSSHTQAPHSHVKEKQLTANTLYLHIRYSQHLIALESTHYHFHSASI